MKLFLLILLTSMLSTAPIQLKADSILPDVEISSEKLLIDDDLKIYIKNLFPEEIIKIQAKVIDDNSVEWVSWAKFQANELGQIDLSKQEPLDGSFRSIDSMGLLWSMRPSDPLSPGFKIKRDEFPVTIKVLRDDKKIGSKVVVIKRKNPEVKKIPIRECGLVGTLFLPPSRHPLPVIITLSGSNGGLGENRAQLLASHGFAAFALGYFGVDGLPPALQDISLEYFETAISWVNKNPDIDGSRIGIYGVSRGGELALILGALFPKSIQAIVATVPSSVVYGGLSETPVNAWLYDGKPFAPFAPVPQTDFSGELGKDPNHPASTLQSFLLGMQDENAFGAAAIPVEKIKASLLLISGGDDQMWPSALYARQIQDRLREKRSEIICEHLHYPKAGHGIGLPNLPQTGPAYYHPVGKLWFTLGGSVEEDQRASTDSWSKLIAFFGDALKLGE